MYAAYYGSLPATISLIQNGADLDMTETLGRFALFIATEQE